MSSMPVTHQISSIPSTQTYVLKMMSDQVSIQDGLEANPTSKGNLVTQVEDTELLIAEYRIHRSIKKHMFPRLSHKYRSGQQLTRLKRSRIKQSKYKFTIKNKHRKVFQVIIISIICKKQQSLQNISINSEHADHHKHKNEVSVDW